jgi:hypothetical protein
VAAPIPDAYWNLAGAVYAYVFAHLAQLGIEIAGESQLVGYPTQFPSVTMVDWNSGAPNARLRVLELLKTRLSPQDAVVKSGSNNPYSLAQAFRGTDGSRKLLLVNKRDHDLLLQVPGFSGARAAVVDLESAGGPIREETLEHETFRLPAFGVAILTV